MPIWGDIDREEAETLARVLLKRGQRSPGTAATVRAIVNGSDYLSALIITVPRIIRTVDRVRKAPKRVRPSRRERLAMARGAHHEHQA